MKRKYFDDEHKEEEKTDRYLITYSDLITLLLGLFVILYAASQVDESKYKEVSQAFAEYFKSENTKHLEGGGVLPGHKQGVPQAILPTPKKQSLAEVKGQAEQILSSYIKNSNLKIQSVGESLVLTLPELLLFNTGKADIQSDGQVLLDSLAKVLSGINFQIAVDGHTDGTPIRTFRYESNWHLSVARALNVGYSLINRGVSEENILIRGFGATRPVASNSDEEGKQKNRRVEITISQLPEDAPTKNGYKSGDSNKL